MGTTNRGLTFSPANSGKVHILVIASRAELACRVHMPGSPEFRAINRSRLSLTHLADDDPRRPHPQGLGHQAAQWNGTGALQTRLPTLHPGDVPQGS